MRNNFNGKYAETIPAITGFKKVSFIQRKEGCEDYTISPSKQYKAQYELRNKQYDIFFAYIYGYKWHESNRRQSRRDTFHRHHYPYIGRYHIFIGDEI